MCQEDPGGAGRRPALYNYQKEIRDREPSERGRIWLAAGIRRMLESLVCVGHVVRASRCPLPHKNGGKGNT